MDGWKNWHVNFPQFNRCDFPGNVAPPPQNRGSKNPVETALATHSEMIIHSWERDLKG